MIQLKSFYVSTTSGTDLITIGHEVRGMVKEGSVGKNGWVTLMAPQPGATFGVGPRGSSPNGARPNRGANLEVVKGVPSLVIPVMGGRLVIEPWQEVFLIDEDKAGKRREFFIQMFVEEPPPAAGGKR